MPESGVVDVGSRKVIMLLLILSDEDSAYTCISEYNIRLLYETEM